MHRNATPNRQPPGDALRLWHHIFGDRPDLIQLFTGFRKSGEKELLNTAERYYTTDHLEDAVTWAKEQDSWGREVFFCVHQLLAEKRIKPNAASVTALWCDVDEADLTSSPLTPTAVVRSSPGRYHAYLHLAHPIAPHVAENLNQRWAKSFGADGSGFDLTQLLRVPGTRNHKYIDSPAVSLVSIDDKTTHSVADLERILPPLRAKAVATGPVQTPNAVSEDDQVAIATMHRDDPRAGLVWADDTSEWVDKNGHVDESRPDYALFRSVMRVLGLDTDRAHRVLWQSPRAKSRADRWGEHRNGYVDFLDYELQRVANQWSAEEIGPSSPALHFDELGNEADSTGGQCCGHLRQIAELKQRLADLQAQSDWQDKFRRKKKLTAGDKLVGAALADLHAAAEARGQVERIPIVIEATRDLEAHPERATWTDRTLTGRTGLCRSSISRSLERYTDEINGVWRLESDSFLTQDGLRRPRLYLVPKASAAETRAAVLDFEPPEAEPAKPTTPKLVRCRHHPMARVNEDTTWRCHLCGRHCQPERRKVIDPTDYVPPVLTDEQITGEAEPGPVPGRELWNFPARHFDELVAEVPPAPSPVVTNGRHFDELGPQYWPVYDRVPSTDMATVANGHACHDCGGGADPQWGPVVECGPPGGQVWLHAGADAPCRVPAAVVALCLQRKE